MPMFQHSDGTIFVRTDTGIYGDTLENFALDFGEAAPSLPEGYIGRIYEPNVRHAISNGESVIGGPLPFDFGDLAIGAIAALLAAKAARETPPPPPEPAPFSAPPTLVAAILSCTVVDGELIAEGNFNIVAAAYFGVGTYAMFFSDPQSDSNYFVEIASGASHMEIVEKETDYFVIGATDPVSGEPIDPVGFSFQVNRIAT